MPELDTKNTPSSWNDPEKQDVAPWSLLEKILETQSKQESWDEVQSELQATWSVWPTVRDIQTIKRNREPISPAMFMKFIGTILFISIIFFGSFLTYIVFNPDQATFFINIFGINPNDIASLLKRLINGSFGVVMFILSILWILSLFRAIWTPKDLKRKRLLSWLSAGLIGIILFSILSFWAFLFKKINLIDFTNLKWSILIYDNDLYTHDKTRDYSLIQDGSNIFGPLTLLFDLRSNAAQVARSMGVTIKGYRIDTDGWICNDGSSVVTGNNVVDEKSIVCNFSKIKPYNINGEYTIITRAGEEQKILMNINPIEIRGLVNIVQSKNIQGKPIISLDAWSLKRLGNPRWVFKPSNKVIENSSITQAISNNPQYVCLRLLSEDCDRMFILEDKDIKDVKWSITSTQDTIDPLLFHLGLSWASIDTNQIINIEWLLVNNQWSLSVICTKWGDTCDFRFGAYGIAVVQAQIETASHEKYSLQTQLSVREPLQLSRNMKVLDENGILLNTTETYKTDLKAFVIENTLTPPANLTLDARDVTAGNEGYKLESVVWKIANAKNTEEKRGDKITIMLLEPLRYTITWIYTFRRTSGNEIQLTQDSVIIDIEKKSLIPRMQVKVSSDYVPSVVIVDASQSESDHGEIKKFIFDFWEWKTPAEWDAIQQYGYVTPGEHSIELTIINENGEKATMKKTIVLKDEAKKIEFIPSMTPWIANTSIDFEAQGTNWQIQDYIWNFWDDTASTHGYTTSHTFMKWGTYMINLAILYSDGTRRTETKKYEVREASQ